MSSTFVGSSLRISIFGQSHSKAIGMTMDGLPAGIPISTDQLQIFLNRRAPGRNNWSTPRKEWDQLWYSSDGCHSQPQYALIRL